VREDRNIKLIQECVIRGILHISVEEIACFLYSSVEVRDHSVILRSFQSGWQQTGWKVFGGKILLPVDRYQAANMS